MHEKAAAAAGLSRRFRSDLENKRIERREYRERRGRAYTGVRVMRAGDEERESRERGRKRYR